MYLGYFAKKAAFNVVFMISCSLRSICSLGGACSLLCGFYFLGYFCRIRYYSLLCLSNHSFSISSNLLFVLLFMISDFIQLKATITSPHAKQMDKATPNTLKQSSPISRQTKIIRHKKAINGIALIF